MRILCLSSTPDLPETHLFARLSEIGVKVTLMTEPQWLASENAEYLAGRSVALFPLKCRSRLDPAAILAVRRMLKAAPVDLIHSFSARSLSTALIASTGMRLKHVTYRGTIGHVHRLDPAAWLTYLNPRISKIICVSKAVEQYLLSLSLPLSRLCTIHKGHELSWYDSPYSRDIWTKELKLALTPANVITFVSNVRPAKGVEILLAAFSNLAVKEEDIHLVLIGAVSPSALTSFRDSVPRAINQNVHFLGFRADAAKLVGASDLFVLPVTRREGFPKALIEAMAQSVPCLSTLVGGIPELIVSEENGILVRPGDVNALSAAMRDLLENRQFAESLGRKAREHIGKRLSHQTTVSRTLEVYEEVLRSNNYNMVK